MHDDGTSQAPKRKRSNFASQSLHKETLYNVLDTTQGTILAYIILLQKVNLRDWLMLHPLVSARPTRKRRTVGGGSLPETRGAFVAATSFCAGGLVLRCVWLHGRRTIASINWFERINKVEERSLVSWWSVGVSFILAGQRLKSTYLR